MYTHKIHICTFNRYILLRHIGTYNRYVLPRHFYNPRTTNSNLNMCYFQLTMQLGHKYVYFQDTAATHGSMITYDITKVLAALHLELQ